MLNMWKNENNPLMTKGFDGYTNDNHETTINMTDSALAKTAFDMSIDPGENQENALWLATQVTNQLKCKSDLISKEVEETFADTVADNTNTNLCTFTKINEKYPNC